LRMLSAAHRVGSRVSAANSIPAEVPLHITDTFALLWHLKWTSFSVPHPKRAL
jgi:hypothetical protein